MSFVMVNLKFPKYIWQLDDGLFPSDKSEKEIGLIAELGVDFGLDNNGALWIIEVNGKPNKNIYKEIMDIQELSTIYQRPLEYALFLPVYFY